MIHKVKSLYDEGHGLSERAIAKKVGITRNTVGKYIKMNENEIQLSMSEAADRKKQLDDYKDSIVRLLQTFPRMSAVKVLRKLKDKVPELTVSERSMRRYISRMKTSGVIVKRIRHYEPVVDMLPGMQCQVDGGELNKVSIEGMECKVYFIVFVLSCSRLMYISASLKPIDTEMFIHMHDAAFRSFGGMPEECVYDQTKLVVINEQYMELDLNQRFAQYATTVGFRIYACHGYDPESKGKVEAGVRYVKESCLYGESFENFSALEQHIANWLTTVANVRIHAATHSQPIEYYNSEEKKHMKPYLTPDMPEIAPKLLSRGVDKTGLISWDGNKYSVPMQYQRSNVYVRENDGELLIYDLGGIRIAVWAIGSGKGELFKNRNHYRDPAEQISELEAEIKTFMGNDSRAILQSIKRANPRIYKDQLRGLYKELIKLGTIEKPIMIRLLARDTISVMQLVEIVEALRANLPEVDGPMKEHTPRTIGNSELLRAYSEVSHAVN